MIVLKKTLKSFWNRLFEQVLKKSFLFFIGFYKCHLSGFFGGGCRFVPSCSSYAEEALQKHPLKKACFLILKRLLRCHPFHKDYGYDPLESKG